jgi:flagellar motor switch protein FliN/FliY
VSEVAIQSPAVAEGEGALAISTLISRLPVEVDVAIPIRKFRVRNLLALAAGTVIPSQWEQGEDMPLAAKGAQLAWAEFEVIDQKLGVRITRLV